MRASAEPAVAAGGGAPGAGSDDGKLAGGGAGVKAPGVKTAGLYEWPASPDHD
jgi:hypothetical protein